VCGRPPERPTWRAGSRPHTPHKTSVAAGDVGSQVLHDAQDFAQDRCRPHARGQPVGIVTTMSRLDRITSDPAICHGRPTIRGLRYTGMTVDEVLADYPDLERDDILAALEFGARAAGGRVVPLSAA
jgi:uncharacterized protein (DUF433 family)